MMTVGELIKLLRKYPSDAVVGLQDHDQSEGEISGYVRLVEEASEKLKESHGIGVVLIG